MTQRDRILRMLDRAGAAGVHSFEFFEARMPRAAAAIHTLRKAGYDIESRPEPFRGEANGVRYYLHEARPPVSAPEPPGDPDGLFDNPVPAPASQYDPWGEAA